MNSYSIDGIRISGISACVPKDIEYTASYDLFSEVEARTFQKKVGVVSKRNSHGRLTTADLCYEAAEKLIADLDWQKKDIGLVIFVTQTPDYILPPSATILHRRLGLSSDTVTFDISLGCTGWVNGLSISSSIMRTQQLRKSLLLVGETAILSDYSDRSTYPLMGDAGVATAIEICDQEAAFYFNSHTDSSRSDAIIAPNSAARHISNTAKQDPRSLSMRTQMDGAAIFEFSKELVLPSISRLLSERQLMIDDIDFFVFHQANKLIVESMRRKLGIEESKCLYSIDFFGNTSSASIPLTIVKEIGSINNVSKKIFCSSFGVGLSLANVIVDFENLFCSRIVEL